MRAFALLQHTAEPVEKPAALAQEQQPTNAGGQQAHGSGQVEVNTARTVAKVEPPRHINEPEPLT